MMVTVAWSLKGSGETELVRTEIGSCRQDYSDLGYPDTFRADRMCSPSTSRPAVVEY